MTDRKLDPGEEQALWQEAARRLRALDVEPPLTIEAVDAFRGALGPRAPGQDLRSWLRGERRAGADAASAPGAEIIPFDRHRQRFRPVSRFVRLAADTGDSRLALPTRELESEDGRFRLKVRAEADQVILEVQALGHASDTFANRLIGLAAPEDAERPVAVLALDEDGDGSIRLADTPAFRRALLRPAIGLIEEI